MTEQCKHNRRARSADRLIAFAQSIEREVISAPSYETPEARVLRMCESVIVRFKLAFGAGMISPSAWPSHDAALLGVYAQRGEARQAVKLAQGDR